METVRRWIEQGTNPFRKDNNGETPVEFATRWGARFGRPVYETIHLRFLQTRNPVSGPPGPFRLEIFSAPLLSRSTSTTAMCAHDGHYDLCARCYYVGVRCLEDGHELKRVEVSVQHASNSTETAESVSHGIALST
jgi:hypothetical protein